MHSIEVPGSLQNNPQNIDSVLYHAFVVNLLSKDKDKD